MELIKLQESNKKNAKKRERGGVENRKQMCYTFEGWLEIKSRRQIRRSNQRQIDALKARRRQGTISGCLPTVFTVAHATQVT